MLSYFVLLAFLRLTASYTVIPDDGYYPNATCLHCHNLQYYFQNASKYFTSNIQLLFLPGLHYLYTDIIIENVHNVSIIGRNSDMSSVIQCNSSVGIIMKNITNLLIENMAIQNCQTNSAAVIITECNGVKLLYLKIYHLPHRHKQIQGISLLGHNMMGNVYLNHITCDEQLRFYYNKSNATGTNHVIFLEHYSIMNVENFTQSYTYAAVYVELSEFYNYSLMFQISNTTIKSNLVLVKSKCTVKCNTIVFTNCQFDDYNYKSESYLLALININAYITNCHFVNHYRDLLIGMKGGETVVISYCTFHHNKINGGLIYTWVILPNITIDHCEFYNNTGSIINARASRSRFPKFSCAKIITVSIKNTTFLANKLSASLISIDCSRLLLMGAVRFHRNNINLAALFDPAVLENSLIVAHNTTITLYGYIEFLQNTVGSLIQYKCITEECFTMNVAGNATLFIAKNTVGTYFVSEWNDHLSAEKLNYPPCFFQYLKSNTTDTNHLIVFNKNFVTVWFYLTMIFTKFVNFGSGDHDQRMGLPITHCYWSAYSAFNTTTIPLDVNEKHVKFINNSESLPQMNTKKLLCYCTDDVNYDCYKDDLGYLYPGQTAILSFCYPDNLTTSNYAEVSVDISINGTHFTPCVVHNSRELIQFTSKKCTRFQYTIAFSTDNWCELFLKMPFMYSRHMEYNVFYVRQLPCPIGFIKTDGICQCYPSFEQFGITDCNINNQTILRPVNSWISATSQGNYYISLHCPFHYCIQHSFHLNLSTPDLQCQFNRSGILCGHCQMGFSTVFGSPNCQHCSNVYLLLIIPIAIAGIALVLLLFVLNLTVTDGTINAFILYANIISVNGTTFFPYNQSRFAYVFISLANLDLGINVCFYNGMDDYAKMWLQLAFPFYLIFIAILLIIASRYSHRIQKITAHRALPVLATLFLLSYTKILRIISIVLFFYSPITHLPSKHTTHVWSMDANVTLFGVQFTLLFVVCLILFLVLIPFNIVLLFTKTVSSFNIVTKFKPLLDAYQGPYKIKLYYWTGLQLMLRIICFSLSSLDSKINFTTGLIILGITNAVHAYSKPFKSNIKSYQESLFIINLLSLYSSALSFGQNEINKISVDILISLAAIQFILIVFYHIFIYACGGTIQKTAMSMLHTLYGWMDRFYKKPQACDQRVELHLYCDIPEVTHNYHEYQEPLIGQEYS